MFLILELCEGGELFDRLHAQAGSHYDEAQAARLMHSMCAAISYIHFRGISHRFVRVALLAVFDSSTQAAGHTIRPHAYRDLKLENFIFESKDPDSDLKLSALRAEWSRGSVNLPASASWALIMVCSRLWAEP